jgi:choline dehydrogenase-like flavoprotein
MGNGNEECGGEYGALLKTAAKNVQAETFDNDDTGSHGTLEEGKEAGGPSDNELQYGNDMNSRQQQHLWFSVSYRRKLLALQGMSVWGYRLLLLLGLMAAVSILSLVFLSACKARGRTFYTEAAPNGFDYIIVGGGPSGIITATKLAKAFPHLRVLLLESGTDSQSSVIQNTIEKEKKIKKTRTPPPHIKSSTAVFQATTGTLNEFDVPLMWSGVASDQGRRQVMHMEESWSEHHWPIKRTLLGRALGGCGMHNAMIYVRALSTDFARWNLTGWTFENILPHYVAMEHFSDTSPKFASLFWKDDHIHKKEQAWRGTNGPVTTVPAGVAVDAIAPLFVQSALNSGHRLAARGFNDPDPGARIGAGYYEFNIRNGVRDSIANALLGRRKCPSNLIVQTGVTVTQVLVSSEQHGGTPHAIGVEYVRDQSANVRKFLLTNADKAEVILASGAILTPQLLFNSGIGAGGSVVDLPGVGKNLQDHPVTAMTFQITPEIAQQASSIYTVADEMEDYFLSVAQLESSQSDDASKLTDEVQDDLKDRLGTLGTAGFSAGAFLRSPWAEDESPDIQLTVFPRVIEPHVVRKQRRGDEAFMRSSVMLVTIALLRPEARYEVRPSSAGQRLVQPLADSYRTSESSKSHKSHKSHNRFKTEVDETNPLAKVLGYRLPSIELPADRTDYLSDLDVTRIAWGMEQVRKIQQMPPLVNQTMGEVYPGVSVTDGELRRYIRVSNLPNSHWVGSTKMGAANDPLAVVDEELRVRGVHGLRIVDSGVIPHAPNGNTHSTVCVVACRAADLIADFRRKP